MTFLPTTEPPPLQPLPAIRPPQQHLHLLWGSRSQTRDVAVVDEAEGNQGDDVGEEELEGPVAEVEWAEDSNERSEEEDGEQAGEGAGLKLEDSVDFRQIKR